MRTLLLTLTSVSVFGLAASLRVEPEKDKDAIKVRVRLRDESSGKGVAGILRVYRGGETRPLSLTGLLDRLRGLERSATSGGWYVVPLEGAETTLPRAALRLEAVSGLESARASQEVDLSQANMEEVAVKLGFLFRPEEHQLFAGNTHLHLRNLTREQADDYLRRLPVADGLKVLFISYLERDQDDREYITNRYPIGSLAGFEATGVLLSNGEEHRHNFTPYGQGYGHVMFLDITKLVRPVSLGPGITNSGTDDLPLRGGLIEAREQGGTVLWCHNTNGFEAAPSALAGRFDALNVFDGSRQGTYEERYYRFLNLGLRLPLSTGTDWFLYDFARVYARVPDKLTVPSWLAALKSGRCMATNGPLLTLKVNGREPGALIELDRPKSVRLEATGLGRHDFQRLQLVQNGKVVQTQSAARQGRGYVARIDREVRVDAPAWFAVRIESDTKNELGCQLFAHSSPVYVNLSGKRVFDVEAARGLQRELEQARDEIKKNGRFSTPAARDKILALYEEAEREVVERLNRRGQ
jgi:hypothetical protein